MKQEAAVEPNDKFLDDIARDDVLLVSTVEEPAVERLHDAIERLAVAIRPAILWRRTQQD